MATTSDQSDSSRALMTSAKQLIAGGMGGICLVLAGHPLDTIKVRIQTMPTPAPGERPQFNGTFDCISKTFRREGIRGFYRGMLAPLIGAIPINSICFVAYGLGVRLQTHGSPTAVNDLTSEQLFKAGMLSGFCTSLLNAPAERIKCLLQIEQGSSSNAKYKGFWDCASKVYTNGGISSSYRGLLATFARDIPASGTYFWVYELLKKNGEQLFYTSNQVAITLLSGGFAGISYWVVAIPADVIKSKFQTAYEGKYSNGYKSVIKSIIEKQGLTGLYRGAIPVFIRAFPRQCILFYRLYFIVESFRHSMALNHYLTESQPCLKPCLLILYIDSTVEFPHPSVQACNTNCDSQCTFIYFPRLANIIGNNSYWSFI